MALLESNTTATNNRDNIYGSSRFEGQTFTIGTTATDGNYNITSTKWKIWKTGSPGTITAVLKAVDGDGLPTGSDLSTGTYAGNTLTASSAGEVIEISMSSYEMQETTQYAIYLKATDGDSSNKIGSKFNYQGNPYSGGTWIATSSGDGGWGIQSSTSDFYFEVYGTAATAGTKFQINKDDVWKDVSAIKINVDDAWKNVTAANINVDDAWKAIF